MQMTIIALDFRAAVIFAASPGIRLAGRIRSYVFVYRVIVGIRHDKSPMFNRYQRLYQGRPVRLLQAFRPCESHP